MSSMDSGINTIAAVIIKEFLHPAGQVVGLARTLTVGLGGLAMVLAFYVSSIGGIIKAPASFMSLFSALLLALILLGILIRRGNFQGWLCGLAVAVQAALCLQNVVKAHWVYYFPSSFLIAFSIA